MLPYACYELALGRGTICMCPPNSQLRLNQRQEDVVDDLGQRRYRTARLVRARAATPSIVR